MKTINNYLIEKLIISKNTQQQKVHIRDLINFTKVDFPICDIDESIVKDKTWKMLDLPTCKYIVFNDKYRGDRPHFHDTEDFILSLGYFQDDYENFNPDKDILYGSDNLHEILEWYFENFGVEELPTKGNFYEWVDEYSNVFEEATNDNLEVLGSVYIGDDKFYNKNKKPNYKNIKKFLEDYLY